MIGLSEGAAEWILRHAAVDFPQVDPALLSKNDYVGQSYGGHGGRAQQGNGLSGQRDAFHELLALEQGRSMPPQHAGLSSTNGMIRIYGHRIGPIADDQHALRLPHCPVLLERFVGFFGRSKPCRHPSRPYTASITIRMISANKGIRARIAYVTGVIESLDIFGCVYRLDLIPVIGLSFHFPPP